ncbi:hypothetical protein P0D88_39190 [Paraburkholderia sp. RL18-103-BIB-C]|uniref:hypothetical protein n=1 Tax=Paraburkholderia sp. RL18-103-BIB-C TaxID=3031637 RepID=UPI0038BA3CBC
MHRKLAFAAFPKLIPILSTYCCAPAEETASEDAELAQRYVAAWVLSGILSETEIGESATVSPCDSEDDELLIRLSRQLNSASARVWLDNWQRMLPYLVTSRGLIPPTLPGAIVRLVKQSQRLLDIERKFASTDPVLVRATLFGLLHDGRVRSHELQTQPLSLLTSFIATDEQL